MNSGLIPLFGIGPRGMLSEVKRENKYRTAIFHQLAFRKTGTKDSLARSQSLASGK
jgi:hypothetical protein